MRYRFRLICLNYNFDFLVLYKMYFQNYFARRSIILESFTSHLQHSREQNLLFEFISISIFYLFLSFIACILILEVVRAHIDNSDLCTEMFLPSVKICNSNSNLKLNRIS